MMVGLWWLVPGKVLTAEPNWPQWRGPDGSGVSPEKDLPIVWSETENIASKTRIPGRGHSSPIAWEKWVLLTTSLEGPVVPGAKAPIHYINGQVHPLQKPSTVKRGLRVRRLLA